MFIAGRTLVGAAGPFGKISAIGKHDDDFLISETDHLLSALLHEIAHPRLRPVLATAYYANYYVGSLSSAWFCYGALDWGTNNWAWRAPCLFQIMAPVVILLHYIILPESPRFMIRHDKVEKGLKTLADNHANGDLNDELVRYEYHEIIAALKLEEESKRVSYMDFLRTPGNRRRLLVIVALATGTNWNGSSIISYYLAPMLRLVGITDPRKISAINGGLAGWNLILAYTCAFIAEKVGRRPLWLVSTAGMLGTYILLTGLNGSFAHTRNSATGLASVPFLFIFYGFYDFAWTPLPCK
jgi:MFS family permease